MRQRYPIPAQTVRTETVVSRSRFIATAGYADTVEAARTFIQAIRQEMPDATHHVYAFCVGYGSSVNEGLSDDGEPAGTSGKPVMAVLRGAKIGDAVLVVTRYFGGTKLGTGGLVRAYSAAAKAVLEVLPRTEKVTLMTGRLTCPYAAYEPIKRLLAEYDGRIAQETFTEQITLQFSLPEEYFQDFSQHVRDVGGRCE